MVVTVTVYGGVLQCCDFGDLLFVAMCCGMGFLLNVAVC